MKQIGCFISKEIVTKTGIALKTKNYLEEVRLSDFVYAIEEQKQPYDSLKVATFQHLQNPSQQVIAYLLVYPDEFDSMFCVEYVVEIRNGNDKKIMGYVPIGEESQLYDLIFDTLCPNHSLR